jgi:hypothetical protein
MKVFKIFLHSLFLLLGVSLLFNTLYSPQVVNLLCLVLFAYTILSLSISVLKEVFLLAFPRHFGILLVFAYLLSLFFLKKFELFTQNELIYLLITLSVVLASYFLFSSIVNIRFNLNYRNIRTSSFRNKYWLNYIIFLILIAASLVFVLVLLKGEVSKNIYYSLAVLLALYPHLNRNQIRTFSESLNALSKNLDLSITFNQIGKLAKIRNFVFFKDKFIESGDYKMVDTDYRSTVRVISVLQLCYQLSEDWNKKYKMLFIQDEFERKEVDYKIVEQNNDGITVIDDGAIMYHFGNYSYVKEKTKRDNKANLFLLKNEIPIAKFTVNEKIADEKAEFINQLDYFGNTILFNHSSKEDLGRDYDIVFDRVYSGLNETKQLDLLKELNKKAPTAFFSTKDPGKTPSDLNFYITAKTDVKKSVKKVVCSAQSLLQLPKLINHVKKVHTFIRYALYTSLLIQLLIISFALFNPTKLVLILSINLFFVILSEIVLKRFSKKLY